MKFAGAVPMLVWTRKSVVEPVVLPTVPVGAPPAIFTTSDRGTGITPFTPPV